MKVYQIEKTTGEWEDTYHTIVGTYLNKSRAEAEFERLKQKAKKEYKCMDCPYSWERPDKPLDVDCPWHDPINENEGMDIMPDYTCKSQEDPYDAPRYSLLEFDVEDVDDIKSCLLEITKRINKYDGRYDYDNIDLMDVYNIKLALEGIGEVIGIELPTKIERG